MRHARLGNTDLSVSILGFGAGPLGDEYGRIDPAQGRRAVHAAIDAGINLFDTSPYYGRTLSETRLGEALAGRRHQVVLCSKTGRYDFRGFDFSAARVASSVEESLRRLRTDHLDILLAHDIEFAPPGQVVNETLPAMRRLQEQGKVRWIGVSGFPLELLQAASGEVDVVLSYCHYDLLNTRLSPMGTTGLINGSPLHMGILTPEGPPPWHPAPQEVLAAGREAAACCARRGLELAEMALRFAIETGPADSTLVGMRDERELSDALRALEPEPNPGALAELRALLAPVADREWRSGLDAPDKAHDPLLASPKR